MTPIQKYWFIRLIKGSLDDDHDVWEEELLVTGFRDHLYKFIDDTCGGKHKPSETEIGIHLRKIIPGLKKKRATEKNTLGIRPCYYVFPSLEECREFWCTVLKQDIDWDVLDMKDVITEEYEG